MRYFQKVYNSGSISFFEANEQKAIEETEKYNGYWEKGVKPCYELIEINKSDYEELIDTYHSVHQLGSTLL